MYYLHQDYLLTFSVIKMILFNRGSVIERFYCAYKTARNSGRYLIPVKSDIIYKLTKGIQIRRSN